MFSKCRYRILRTTAAVAIAMAVCSTTVAKEASSIGTPGSPDEGCRPAYLRCEHMEKPLGIDTQSPRLSWQLDDTRTGALQTAREVSVSKDSAALVTGKKVLWRQKKTGAGNMAVYNGPSLEPFTRYYWSVRVWDKDGRKSAPVISSFDTGMISPENWKGSFISDGKGADERATSRFRRDFKVNKEIESAHAYIVAAGLYELSLNGEKVGDHFLDPAFTNYDKRLLYVVHDVTGAIRKGDNAIGVELGNGWYNHQPHAVWDFHNAPWRSRPSFLLNLRICYTDGSVETIVTDGNFKIAESPVTFNAIYVGENYDFSKDMPGWNIPGFDDSDWKVATVLAKAPSENIVSQTMHPIRITDNRRPVEVKNQGDTLFLFDFGQNWSGVTTLHVQGEPGTKIRLHHGEQLDSRGKRLYDDNHLQFYSNIPDADEIFHTDVLKLDGNENQFTPKFNYKGFQYVEVTSDRPIRIDSDNLTSHFIHTDLPVTGTFECSDSLVNRLWRATNYSYLSNLVGYPTDCPQREKNGWTGDAHLAIETGLYNFDGITLYEKWMDDHRDDMGEDGSLHCIIPSGGWGLGPLVDWTCSMTVIPWTIYEFYGDTNCLRENYPAMKRHTDFWLERYPEGLVGDACLGDWITHKAVSDKELTASIYHYKNADIVARTAALLGYNDDAAFYRHKAELIRDAINAKFLNRETGIYAHGFQTEQAMPLYWGVAPDDCRDKIAQALSERVTADKDHLDFGIMGCKTVMNALTDAGHVEQAYRIITQQDYPSWGNWLRQGATTLYENWDYNGLAAGYSQNHIMYGEIGAWLYKALAGINVDPNHPGFSNVILKPHFVRDLDYVKASYGSPHGIIRSCWERKDGKVIYRVTVPANSTATLYLETEGTPRELTAGSYEFEVKPI